ncbi:MAG: cytochrome c oxidase subunit II [Maricaulaceae bacterium]
MRLISKVALTLTSLMMSGIAMASQPKDGKIGFQEAVTPVMEELIRFHHSFVFPVIVAITIFVMALMIYIMVRFNEKANPVPSKTTHHVGLEVAWTLVPILILLVMVVPSMKLLYMQDRLPTTEMTIKVVGHTWHWEYQYPELEDKVEGFESYLLKKEDALAAGKPYLLGTDAPLVVPVDTKVKVIVTSQANLHSFSVPSFGVKMDAVPGRLNETWFQVNPGKEGTYYGQCSELCGIRHAFMPIEVKVVSKSDFHRWVNNGGSFSTNVAQANIAAPAAAPK